MQDSGEVGNRGRANPSMRDDDRGTPERDLRQNADQRGGDMPRQDDVRARQRSQQRAGEQRGDDPAAGSIESPVSPGEVQAGDLSELGANLGGPVDVFPLRGRRRKERPAG